MWCGYVLMIVSSACCTVKPGVRYLHYMKFSGRKWGIFLEIYKKVWPAAASDAAGRLLMNEIKQEEILYAYA